MALPLVFNYINNDKVEIINLSRMGKAISTDLILKSIRNGTKTNRIA